MQTVPISPFHTPGAEAALGGPPLPMPPIAAPMPPEPAAPAAPPPPAFLTGVDTFDPEPAEVAARRALVAKARAGLRAVIDAVMTADETLSPILAELGANAAAVKADGFDPRAAKDLLTALSLPILALTIRPNAKPADKPAKP